MAVGVGRQHGEGEQLDALGVTPAGAAAGDAQRHRTGLANAPAHRTAGFPAGFVHAFGRHDAALRAPPHIAKARQPVHRLAARVVGAPAVDHFLGKERQQPIVPRHGLVVRARGGTSCCGRPATDAARTMLAGANEKRRIERRWTCEPCWWAVQGSNLRPLPCEGRQWGPRRSEQFSKLLIFLGRLPQNSTMRHTIFPYRFRTEIFGWQSPSRASRRATS